jgi:ADP-dependent NAD(P)H-hydrate dehydratase
MSPSDRAEVVVTPAVLRGWPLPDPGDGKQARGSVLVVGGSRRTPGAVMLSGLAALRVGAGQLKIATTSSTATAVAVAVPEALVLGLPETNSGEIAESAAEELAELAAGVAAVVVGPGCADLDAARRLVGALLDRLHGADRPVVVLDAFALSVLGSNDVGLGLDERTILTPNAGEAAAALGMEPDDVSADLGAAALALCDRFGTTVTVRQAETWTTSPGRPAYCDQHGNPGLGTSGSGDVLSGAVGGLAARRADPLPAALWAVHVHALAGQRLADRVGPVGYLARELLDELPGLLAALRS